MEGSSGEGAPRAGRTAGPAGTPGASVRRWITGAGTPDDGTADTVRGVAFAGRRATISGGAVRRARTGAGFSTGGTAGPEARDADPETARTTRRGPGGGSVPGTGGVGPGSVPVSAPSGAEGTAARSTNGAPEGAVRGVPGVRATPCTSPTGADGSTAWPRPPSL
ncbi:hypothetical protein [Streptomyces sp. NPDC091040]|uniref:hypothetical protein n=1 Tax=Streptomyces sp. NPDC091040 TaxID=3365972 RepID=UPI003813B269